MTVRGVLGVTAPFCWTVPAAISASRGESGLLVERLLAVVELALTILTTFGNLVIEGDISVGDGVTVTLPAVL